MARNLTEALKTELTAAGLSPFLAAEIELVDSSPQEYVRVWTGGGPLSWDGKVWDGVGKFGGVSEIAESAELRANGVRLTLSGVPSGLVSNATTTLIQGKPVILYLGALDAAGAVVANPCTAFSGYVDQVSMEEGGQTANIEVACENELLRLQIPRSRRYTDADQQQEYPGDKGFEYVAIVAEQPNLVWGKAPVIPWSGGGGVDIGGGEESGREGSLGY